jgi:hypothetical protein
MSSEVVLTPAITLAAAGVVIAGIATFGVGTCAYGVGKIIKGIVDKQVEAAMREMEAERAKINEWHSFQDMQRKQMLEYQNVHQAIAESEKRLASIQLSTVKTEKRSVKTQKGYISSSIQHTDSEAIGSMLQEIAAILEGLPAEFIDAANSPYKLLLKHENRLKKKMMAPGDSLLLEEVISFRENITRTLCSDLNTLKMSHEHQDAILKRTDTLFGEVLTFLNMTKERSHISELTIIRDAIIGMMNAPLKLAGQVETLEKKFASIKSEIGSMVANTAFRSALAESVTRNLTDMGYQSVEGFSRDAGKAMKASMGMPGGERVNIAIHSNNKLSFQVCHETGKTEKKMSPEELAVFRQQEEKWCNDLHQLIRRLTTEGFEYNISLERFIPEASIPVVVVESADDILAEEDEDDINIIYDEPKKRHFDS